VEHHGHLRIEDVGLREDAAASGAEDAKHLLQRAVEVEVVQDRAAVDDVEASGRERQGLGVAALQRDARHVPEPGPSLGEQLRREIEADDSRAARRHPLEKHARAAAQLECAASRRERGPLHEDRRAPSGPTTPGRAVPAPDDLGSVGDLAVVLDLAAKASVGAWGAHW
jgi:hypothetical protein